MSYRKTFLLALLGASLTSGIGQAQSLSGPAPEPAEHTCSASAKCKDGSTVSCSGSGAINAQCWGVDGEGAFCISANVRGGEDIDTSVKCPAGFPNS